MNLGLKLRRCLVTGASRGIGLAVAEALATEGADVILLARDASALEREASRLSAMYGVRAVPVVANMATESAGGQIARGIEGLGGIDVLVNCAGASKFGQFDELNDDDWNDAFQLKVLGYVRAVRAVQDKMCAQRSGRIVNVVGMAGRHATTGYVLGCLNSALLHLTKTWAEALAPHGVSVVAVNPGSTATDRMNAHLSALARARGTDEQVYIAEYAAGIPAGRLATAQEIAEIVAFLCSDRASYITGSSIDVEGGAMRGTF